MGRMIELTDDNFKSEVLESQEPVLVDFWAAWCGPCKALAPIIEEVAAEMETESIPMKFGKMDVEAHRTTSGAYGVMHLPTLLVFKGGEVAKKLVGLQPKKKLKAALMEVA